MKSASTGAARGNSDVQGSRRIYRGADIRELMRTNPQRYEDLQDEIMRAYAEGVFVTDASKFSVTLKGGQKWL